MFTQMKSRRNSSSSDKTHPDDRILMLKVLMVFFIMLISFLFILWNYSDHKPATVMVGDKECEIQFVQTGRTSWGSPRGYRKVVCPTEK